MDDEENFSDSTTDAGGDLGQSTENVSLDSGFEDVPNEGLSEDISSDDTSDMDSTSDNDFSDDYEFEEEEERIQQEAEELQREEEDNMQQEAEEQQREEEERMQQEAEEQQREEEERMQQEAEEQQREEEERLQQEAEEQQRDYSDWDDEKLRSEYISLTERSSALREQYAKYGEQIGQISRDRPYYSSQEEWNNYMDEKIEAQNAVSARQSQIQSEMRDMEKELDKRR